MPPRSRWCSPAGRSRSPPSRIRCSATDGVPFLRVAADERWVRARRCGAPRAGAAATGRPFPCARSAGAPPGPGPRRVHGLRARGGPPCAAGPTPARRARRRPSPPQVAGAAAGSVSRTGPPVPPVAADRSTPIRGEPMSRSVGASLGARPVAVHVRELPARGPDAFAAGTRAPGGPAPSRPAGHDRESFGRSGGNACVLRHGGRRTRHLCPRQPDTPDAGSPALPLLADAARARERHGLRDDHRGRRADLGCLGGEHPGPRPPPAALLHARGHPPRGAGARHRPAPGRRQGGPALPPRLRRRPRHRRRPLHRRRPRQPALARARPGLRRPALHHPRGVERIDVVKGPYYAASGTSPPPARSTSGPGGAFAENSVQATYGSFHTWRVLGIATTGATPRTRAGCGGGRRDAGAVPGR